MRKMSCIMLMMLFKLPFSYASSAETELDEAKAVAIAIQAAIRSGDTNGLLKFINQPVGSFGSQRSTSKTRKDLLNKKQPSTQSTFHARRFHTKVLSFEREC